MSNQTKQTAKAAGKSAPSPNKSKEDKVLTELRNKLLNLHEENRILRENALHYKNVNPNQMKQLKIKMDFEYSMIIFFQSTILIQVKTPNNGRL
jgi:hypothetical protein